MFQTTLFSTEFWPIVLVLTSCLVLHLKTQLSPKVSCQAQTAVHQLPFIAPVTLTMT